MGRRRDIVAAIATACFVVASFTASLLDTSSIRYLLQNVLTTYVLAWAVYGLCSTVSRAELISRFSLTTVSITSCLILVEVPSLLRFVDYRAVMGSYDKNTLSVAGRHADRELLWRHDAYYHYDVQYQGNLGLALCQPPDPSRNISVRYDRHGFRNRNDIDFADIVVLGDSYIEGYMMPEAFTVTTRLSQLQGKVVANLGHSGYGPQQELAVLKRYGFSLQPKTVIWAFFEGNDFDDLDYYDEEQPRQTSPLWQTVWYRSFSRNALAQLVYPTGGCTRSSTIEELQARFTDERNHTSRIFFAPSEVQRLSEEKLNKTIAYIAEGARLCRERNIQFVVAFVPEKYRVYRNLRNVELASGTIRSWQVSSLPAEMGRRLADLGLAVEYVDLTQSLQEASQEGIATYFADDTHWTAAGNQLVAETLDRTLRFLPTRTQSTLQARNIEDSAQP
jgi:hypothetical protein